MFDIKENRINYLYQKYKIDAEEPFFNKSAYQTEQANTNISLEEKEKWLKNNLNNEDFNAKDLAKEAQDRILSPISSWVKEALFDTDLEKLEAQQKDAELVKFKTEQQLDEYIENSKKITSDLTLTKEEEIKKLEELGPPPALVREVKQEITIQDQGDALF